MFKSVITHELEHLKAKNTFAIFKEYADDDELGFSVNDNQFLDIMNNQITISSTGNLEALLPLSNNNQLPSNQSVVYHRSKNTL